MDLGFVAVGSTIRLLFTTHAQTGAAVAPNSAFEAADVILYKDGSATQRTSQAGWTMTSPFDSITGLHQIAMDLSDNTDAGFYAAGSTYIAVLSPDETIDGLATVRVIGWFTIGVAPANVTQWLGTAAATPTVAGVPEVDVTHWIGTAAATPTVAGVPEVDLTHLEGVALSAAGAHPRLGIIEQGVAQSASATGLVLRSANAHADDTLIGSVVFARGTTQGYWQERIITDNALSGDTITVDTWTVTPSGAPIDYIIFGAPPASAPITTQLTDIQSRLPAVLVSGRMDSSVGAMAANVMTAAAAAADLTTELQSGLATASALATVDGIVDTLVAAIITLAVKTGAVTTDAGNSATAFETDLSETANDHWKDAFLTITSGALVGQTKKVTAYDGTTKIITVSGGFTGTPADGVTFAIVNR